MPLLPKQEPGKMEERNRNQNKGKKKKLTEALKRPQYNNDARGKDLNYRPLQVGGGIGLSGISRGAYKLVQTLEQLRKGFERQIQQKHVDTTYKFCHCLIATRCVELVWLLGPHLLGAMGVMPST